MLTIHSFAVETSLRHECEDALEHVIEDTYFDIHYAPRNWATIEVIAYISRKRLEEIYSAALPSLSEQKVFDSTLRIQQFLRSGMSFLFMNGIDPQSQKIEELPANDMHDELYQYRSLHSSIGYSGCDYLREGVARLFMCDTPQYLPPVFFRQRDTLQEFGINVFLLQGLLQDTREVNDLIHIPEKRST